LTFFAGYITLDLDSADVFRGIGIFCRFFAFKDFLSYRPLKKVWADPPTAVRFRVKRTPCKNKIHSIQCKNKIHSFQLISLWKILKIQLGKLYEYRLLANILRLLQNNVISYKSRSFRHTHVIYLLACSIENHILSRMYALICYRDGSACESSHVMYIARLYRHVGTLHIYIVFAPCTFCTPQFVNTFIYIAQLLHFSIPSACLVLLHGTRA
jgi:hypothetical protein